MRARDALTTWVLLGVWACRVTPSAPADEAAEHPSASVKSIPWPDRDELVGVSGAAQHPVTGEIWVSPERTGALVAQPLSKTGLGPPRIYPIRGLAPGTDVEALSFVPGRPGRILLGTEARGEREQDPILVARILGRSVEVNGALVFDYAPFGIAARNNQGIEGLCAADGWAVAASEAIIEEEGRRFAAVGSFALTTTASPMRPFRVALRSAKGKLSGLTCRANSDHVVVYAIERHFGIMRLVRFRLPRSPGPMLDVDAVLVTDLAPQLGPQPPNIEGLTWVGDRLLLAVTDNHYRRKTGPVRAFSIRLP